MSENVQDIVSKLDLQPHPEGGFFKETYRSKELISKDNLGNQYAGERNFSTCIYFLLTEDNFSAFHKIHQDEIWHFYKGSTIDLHIIDQKGNYQLISIGPDILNGESLQYVVEGGSWFAAEVKKGFALVGCTVAPGFDFQDFELANKAALSKAFPNHISIIEKMCRN